MELIMLVSPLVLSGRLTDNQRAVRKKYSYKGVWKS